MKSNLRFNSPDGQLPPTQCPKCGSKDILRQCLPDGNTEYMCMDLDCDFNQLMAGAAGVGDVKNLPFSQRVSTMAAEQLDRMRTKLEESAQNLEGRPGRMAARQLAILCAEQRRRSAGNAADPVNSESAPAVRVPPQFNTPQATARRIQGIRDYYQRRKTGRPAPSPRRLAVPPTRWFDTLVKTLRDEASRHEQAAHNYARVPDLFVLHIEHSARAFELNRIIDMLNNYLPFMIEGTGKPYRHTAEKK